MDGSTAVWLGLTLAAPLTLVPEIALLRLLHSRRAAWHPLDVLIVSLLVGQLCCTLVTLGLSATALARHAGLLLGSEPLAELLHHRTPLCAALISFWAAAHTLHAATLTSMAVDRAMTIRWPYKYRVSVRRTQIRYHVVVLAVVSLLVGVATLFASTSGIGAAQFPAPRPSYQQPTLPPAATNATEPIAEAVVVMESNCNFLPYTFDSRFSLFWLCLHGVLLLTTLTAVFVIVVTRIMICCSTGFSGRLGLDGGSGSDMRTLGNASDGSSATLPLPSSAPPTLAAPPPPPRYTPGPVACLSGSAGSLAGHGTATVSPMSRSGHPASMFGSTDKTFMNLLHHHHGESGVGGGMLPSSEHHKTGAADFGATSTTTGCCGGGSWNRQRHSTVAAVLIVAYLTHHLPLLVLTAVGTFFSTILPAGWPFSAIVLGSSLFSGLLFMAVLVFIDPIVYGWMSDSLKPSSRRSERHRHHHHHHHHHHQRSPVTSESATLEQNLAPMKIDEETRYRMSQIYTQEPTEAKFPLTNGSLFVHLMNPTSADGKRANRRPSRMGVSAYDHRPQQRASVMAAHMPEVLAYPEVAKPPLMTFMSRARILAASNGSLKSTDTITSHHHHHHLHQHMEPFYCDPMMTEGIDAPPSFADDVAPVHHVPTPVTASKFKSHEPIYASLSETLSSCHTLDSLGGDQLREAEEEEPRHHDDGEEEEEEEEDEGSATESAGDDFEFHNIRTSRQTLITTASNNSPPEAVFGLEDLRPRSRVARSATYRVLCNGLDVKCASKHDKNDDEAGERAAAAVAATSESRHGIVTCVTIRIGGGGQGGLEQAFGDSSSSSLRRSKLLTSLSMNDIDVLGQSQEDDGGRLALNDGISVQLDVPARSDSLFSLYVPGDESSEPSSPSQSSSSAMENQSLICSAIELSPLERQQQQPQNVINLRKKSIHRSRAAVLQRFQERSRRGRNGNSSETASIKTGSVVSIAALKAALSQSPMSYLDNGERDVYPSAFKHLQQQQQQQQQHQSKTVFVSDYI